MAKKGTGIGMLAVMLASLLPYPRWSLTFVTENQLHANVQMVKVMRTVPGTAVAVLGDVTTFVERIYTDNHPKDETRNRFERCTNVQLSYICNASVIELITMETYYEY